MWIYPAQIKRQTNIRVTEMKSAVVGQSQHISYNCSCKVSVIQKRHKNQQLQRKFLKSTDVVWIRNCRQNF